MRHRIAFQQSQGSIDCARTETSRAQNGLLGGLRSIGERPSLASRDGGDDRAPHRGGERFVGYAPVRRDPATATCAESSPDPETWRTPWPAAGCNRPAARRTIRKDRSRRKPSRPGRTARTDALGVATRATRELRLERMRTRRRAERRRGAMVPEENERTGECRPVEIEITPPRDCDPFRRPPEVDQGRSQAPSS